MNDEIPGDLLADANYVLLGVYSFDKYRQPTFHYWLLHDGILYFMACE